MGFLSNNFKTILTAAALLVSALLIFKHYLKIKTFLLEVKTELTKVAWSTRQELISSTIVVITITAIMAVFIGVIDISLSKMLSTLLR